MLKTEYSPPEGLDQPAHPPPQVVIPEDEFEVNLLRAALRDCTPDEAKIDGEKMEVRVGPYNENGRFTLTICDSSYSPPDTVAVFNAVGGVYLCEYGQSGVIGIWQFESDVLESVPHPQCGAFPRIPELNRSVE